MVVIQPVEKDHIKIMQDSVLEPLYLEVHPDSNQVIGFMTAAISQLYPQLHIQLQHKFILVV